MNDLVCWQFLTKEKDQMFKVFFAMMMMGQLINTSIESLSEPVRYAINYSVCLKK